LARRADARVKRRFCRSLCRRISLQVNAISQTVMSATMLVALCLRRLSLHFFRIEMIFFIDVITAAMAITVMLFFVKIPLHQKAADNDKAIFTDLRKG
jgi:DHA3 family macrolide efflux protein-like MFS transporter